MTAAVRYGVDIGATKIHAIAVDGAWRTLAEIVRPTGHGVASVSAAVTATLRELGERMPVGAGAVASIGIGIPGIVDRDRRVVSRAVNLGLDELDLAAVVAEVVDAPVVVDNDVNAAAIGAARHLEVLDSAVALLNLGTGIAAGLSVGGRIWHGAYGTAGEIGHHPIPDNPLRCLCGQRGCLETVASGTGLARAWPSDEPQPAFALVRAVEAGDAAARAVFERFTAAVAVGVQLLAISWDPDIIAIGGGLVTMGPALESGVRAALSAREDESPFVASLALGERLRFLSPDDAVAPLGAALLGAGRGASQVVATG